MLSDPEYRAATHQQVERLLRGTPYHSLQLPDGSLIPGLISIESLQERIAAFPIPTDLCGCAVLDIGAASGWNSFEMLRRGAYVTAVDCVEYSEFRTLQNLFSPRVNYLLLDVDELTPLTLGTFDIVLFMGVLYHLRHPLLSLEKVCALTREVAFVESFISDPPGEPLSDSCSLVFYEADELGGQIDNWFGPTAQCLLALCRSAGFARVQLEYISDRRAGITCYRRWEAEPGTSQHDPVWLYSAVNNRTNDIYFHVHKDEYLCIYFRTSQLGLCPQQMRIEVDGYGVNALSVSNRGGDEWQVNSGLPPGLSPGEHLVRLRSTTTRFGNTRIIRVLESSEQSTIVSPSPHPPVEDPSGTPLPAPVIGSIENSLDHSAVFRGYRSERLCCRFTCAENRLRRENILASIDGVDCTRHIAFLTELGDRRWQINLVIQPDLSDGAHQLSLRTLSSPWSVNAEFTIQRIHSR